MDDLTPKQAHEQSGAGASKPKSGSSSGGIIGTIVGAVVVAVAVIYFVGNSRDDAEILDGIGDRVDELYEETRKVDEDGMPTQSDKVFTVDETAKGAERELQVFLSTIFNKSIEQQNAYIGELQNIGWFTILDANRIEADPSFSQSRKIISDARALIARQDPAYDAIFEEGRQQILKLDLSDYEKQKMTEGFNEGLSGGNKAREQIWELELGAVAEIEKIIDLLANNSSSWEILDSQINFQTQAQLDVFNGHLAAVNDIIAKQEAIQNAQRDSAKQTLEDAN